MDPQHRYLLDISVRSATQLFDVNDGVFVGNTEAQTETGRNALSPYAVLSSNPSVACGRISYVFGLRGPSISIDTACSASSAACHFALMHHQTTPKASSQLVYGVLISGAPTQTLAIYRAGMLSPEGRCKVLDAAADGYTRGETHDQGLESCSGTNASRAATASNGHVFRARYRSTGGLFARSERSQRCSRKKCNTNCNRTARAMSAMQSPTSFTIFGQS